MDMKKISIKGERKTVIAELLDTPTAQKIFDALPLSGNAHLWGEEIYFPISVNADQEEDACEEVDPGSLAFWPPGQAFCIFFGPTPVSTSEKPRAYSAVNVFGTIAGDLQKLKEFKPGELITVEQYQE